MHNTTILEEGDGFMTAKKGTYVQISTVLLKPEERAENLPEITSKSPLTAWIKGELMTEAELYEQATIKTLTGRFLRGDLKEIEPRHKHDFGNYVEELDRIRAIIKKEMWDVQNG